jgi:putative heme-binding domain-containing protein
MMLAALPISLLFSVSASAADWIWSQANREAATSAAFAKSFAVKQPVTSAQLRIVAESAALSVSLNNALLAEIEPYDPLLKLDVTEHLRIQDHTLSVTGVSVPGPAAFFVQLDLTFADGSQQSIGSDTNWQVSTKGRPQSVPAVSLGSVDSRFLISRKWQVGISATDNYEQWRQAQGTTSGSDPATFLITPEFQIQLVRTAQANEDSWVSLAFDPQGRAIIAMEKKGILRMELAQDGSTVTSVETINDSLLECRGLLFFSGDLFVNANNSKGLYRLPADGPDKFGEPKLLYESSGGVGHGRNDLALGPDNQIYMIHGDAVDLPKESVDHTSPYRDARNGKKTKEGHLLRIDPNGGRVEVLAGGLRNPFGIDFNSYGDVFTYDADAEHDMGSPWYRPTRVSHLVTGGDYGWRGVTGSWPPYYTDHPDNARPNLDIGKGSPTAVKFGTKSNFPTRYRQALFILDWAYGRILAVHPSPRGSSYLLTAETFLKGRPLNVTDLDFGRDGSMYFVTGGRGTQSALYRIRYTGRKRPTGRITPQQDAREKFATAARVKRRRLESWLLKNKIDEPEFKAVWKSLSDADPWIRHAARNVLERQPVKRWKDLALAEGNRSAALESLLALARSKDASFATSILKRLNELVWQDGNRSQRLTAIHTYQLCLRPQHRTPSGLLASVSKKLQRAYPDRSTIVNQPLSVLVASFRTPQTISKTIDLLNTTANQAESMHYLFGLRNLKNGWTLSQRRTYFESLPNATGYLGGAGMPTFLKQIREEAVATLTEDERKSLGKLVDAPPSELIDEAVPPRAFVRKWTVEELASSLTELGKKRNLKRGAELFTAVGCIKCHRLYGRGRLIGPDLSSVRNRFSRRDVLESIISPSKVIPEKYRSLQVITTKGKSFVGRAVLGGDFRSQILRLATDPAKPYATIEIKKTDIELQRPSPTSWMPEGTLNTLTKAEVLDLLAFIERSQP